MTIEYVLGWVFFRGGGYFAHAVAAFNTLLQSFPTPSPNQPLLTYLSPTGLVTVTVSMLARALSILLDALHLDAGLFLLHSLRQGAPQLITDKAWTLST